MTDDNLIFTGCEIETYSAPLVTTLKAISEGYTKFNAICLWAAKTEPKLDEHAKELLNSNIKVILVHGDKHRIIMLHDN